MKKLPTMTKILIGLAIFLILFTIGMIIIFLRTGSEMSTLITCVFSICGGECGIMGWIRTTKDKMAERGSNDNDDADRNDSDREGMGGNV